MLRSPSGPAPMHTEVTRSPVRPSDLSGRDAWLVSAVMDLPLTLSVGRAGYARVFGDDGLVDFDAQAGGVVGLNKAVLVDVGGGADQLVAEGVDARDVAFVDEAVGAGGEHGE